MSGGFMDNSAYCDEIVKKATGFSSIGDLAPMIDSIKDKKIVMLGESTHGTKEFYKWRSLISKELILNHGFNFISVEGDWPPSQKVNRYISHDEGVNTYDVLSSFSRWPSWMWANHEMVELVDWLKFTNRSRINPIGFYGLDVYSLYESIDQVIIQLNKVDPALAMKATYYYSCLDSYLHDEKAYARSLFNAHEGCKKQVLNALNDTLSYKLHQFSEKKDFLFDAVQNARIVCNAENYYRAMIFGEEDSWNVRDNHMMDSLAMLMNHYGPDSKGIVWQHNTHIGDYKATDMVKYGQVNIGGLSREIYGEDKVALIGLTTHHGTVTAASAWDGAIKRMEIPNGKKDSVEAELHNAIPKIGSDNYYLMFKNETEFSPLKEPRGHRAIGVVYQPNSEQRGNYVPTVLADRYDALMFFDETEALEPIAVDIDYKKIPETYPYGARI
jgi:erythromycin esterase-like protein